jgi:membrane-bound lytic murein transglycosylase B
MSVRSALLPFVLCLLPFAHEAIGQDAPGRGSFEAWLEAFRHEARSRGISQKTIDEALADVKPRPEIVARDRAQPEQTQTLDAYLAEHVIPRIIAKARAAAADQAPVLQRVQAQYRIPSPLVVSIWGMESRFGEITGNQPLIPALATLAFDARRPGLFRGELIEALRIVDRGLVPLADLKGSWAGAMGQPQFLPSTFLKYGVDFDGDGRADIWKSEADVFASIANYLKHSGWDPLSRWGREVRIPAAAMSRIEKTVPRRSSGCHARREMTLPRTMDEWKRLGVTLPDGTPLPSAKVKASLVRGEQRHFLVYRNYETILDYNCSNAYAVAAGLLADSIAVN